MLAELDQLSAPEIAATLGINVDTIVACPGGVCWTDAATGKVMSYVACSP